MQNTAGLVLTLTYQLHNFKNHVIMVLDLRLLQFDFVRKLRPIDQYQT